MNKWLRYLPLTDKENAGPRLIIFSLLLLLLSVTLLISNIIFLLAPQTPLVVNINNFLAWGIIFAAFFYTRTENRMKHVVLVMLVVSYLLLFYTIADTGGLFSADKAWAIFMILVAYLFSGITTGIICTAVTLLGLTVYYYVEKTGNLSNRTDAMILDADYVFSTLACVVVVLSLLLWAFVKTLNTLQKQNKELTEARLDELNMMLDSRSREIETLRNKLARDFHDQTGSKLANLKMMSSYLQTKANLLPEEVTEQLMVMERNVNELYEHTRDFIWSIDSRNSSLDEIVLHLSDFGNKLFEPYPIHFDTESDLSALRNYKVPVEHVMQLILIFKEAITNALKYSSCKKIVFQCTIHESSFLMILSDDGKGFEMKKVMRRNGLKNIEERGKAIGSEVEIHSTLTKGTAVSVRYPVNKTIVTT